MSNADSSIYQNWIDAIAQSTANRVQARQKEAFGLATTLVSYTEKQIDAPAFSEHIIVLHLNSIPRLVGKIEGKLAETVVSSGELTILAAEQKSSWEWEQPAVCDVFYLALDSDFIRQVANEDRYTNPDRVEIVNHFMVNDPQIQHIGLALKTELETGERSGRLFQESLATALVTRLLSQYATSPLKIQQRSGGLSKQDLLSAIDYINDNLSQDLRLVDVANVIGLSTSHFTRQFKQTMGITPYQYVIQRRVERAKLLLRRGDLTIQEIALQVGFADQSHLTYLFKRILGVTPKQFLQQ